MDDHNPENEQRNTLDHLNIMDDRDKMLVYYDDVVATVVELKQHTREHSACKNVTSAHCSTVGKSDGLCTRTHNTIESVGVISTHTMPIDANVLSATSDGDSGVVDNICTADMSINGYTHCKTFIETRENSSDELDKVDAKYEDHAHACKSYTVKQEMSTTDNATNPGNRYRTCRMNTIPNYTGLCIDYQDIAIENVILAQKPDIDTVKCQRKSRKKFVKPVVIKKIKNEQYKVCVNKQAIKRVKDKKPKADERIRRKRRQPKIAVESFEIKTEDTNIVSGIENNCTENAVIDTKINALVYGASNGEIARCNSNSPRARSIKRTRRKSPGVLDWRNLPRAKRKPPTPEIQKQRELNRTCRYCRVLLQTPTHRTIHERVHTGDKPYTCGMCRKSYKSSSDLGVHIRRVHTVGNTVPCQVCESKFSTKASLKTHMRIHTGHKPYRCEVCEKEFYQSGHLVYHTRIHTGERPYLCTVCGQSFAQKPHLDRHYRTHTGYKPYHCEVCDKNFSQMGHLRVHQNIHTGERPVSCPVCPRSFALRQHLRVHMRTHSDERPFECEYCFKKFKQNGYLSKHIQLHRDGKMLPHI